MVKRPLDNDSLAGLSEIVKVTLDTDNIVGNLIYIFNNEYCYRANII